MEPADPPSELYLSQAHLAAMREHAAAAAPQEACGVLAGRNGRCVEVITLENVLQSPARYAVAPAALFEVFKRLEHEDWQLLAIFHSHPHSRARPSATDVKNAFYPHTACVILAPEHGEWVCRAFRIHNNQVAEIPLHIS